MNKIINKDCLEALKELPDNSVDSIVTDPPAGISFMNKSWDDDKGGRDNWIAWMQEIATECHRVLKPGGHGLVWSIPRTSHWTAMAWENAGFEIRDNISHVFGSGFPKSLNIGKAVDKLQGNEREIMGIKEQPLMANHYGKGLHNERPIKELENTKGTSEWEGWGTALKPAREDWWLIRKPIEKGLSIAENCLKWGVGGINIDGSRVEGNEEIPTFTRDLSNAHGNKFGAGVSIPTKSNGVTGVGRFPANLIHDGSEEVLELFPESNSPRVNNPKNGVTSGNSMNFGNSSKKPAGEMFDYRDTGSAARFFYCAKASKSERNIGLDGFEEVDSMKWSGGNEMKGLAGTYPDGTPRPQQTQKNFHPTVKPIKLMEYLVNLVSKEGHTVLDPFCGSGTTGIACKKLNRNFIGVERDEEYCKIATARIESVSQNNTLFV